MEYGIACRRGLFAPRGAVSGCLLIYAVGEF
ncbi:hypothetical protein B23_2360 [Geobacillus thermoleovorans B23]|nr:hypothetical protein B23_2360 [Geobacillus thermoleovorans B23]